MLSDMTIMKDQDIARIANRLQVPLIIGDIINGEGALTDDIKMGLHEVLSDDQPDSALLSIALSARAIASNFQGKASIFDMLSFECERVIAEYGMMWLRNAQAKTLDDNTVFETLVHIPEDLECLSELLEFAKRIFDHTNQEAADLCSILITQSQAQSLIAQTFLESMNYGAQEPWKIYEDENMDVSTLVAAEQTAQPFYTDNVIEFPKTMN
ncbi:MAG: hypothetical protein AB8B83_02860 [Bdellovibrionales bacterium]